MITHKNKLAKFGCWISALDSPKPEEVLVGCAK